MKTYHFADKIDEDGNVSALCFKAPKAIDLGRASWTIRAEAVTCRRCKAALKNSSPSRDIEKTDGH